MVILDISMSLDGFVTAANQTPDNPLGDGGELLHRWITDDDPRGQELLAAAAGDLGAVIAGRRTYDHSVRWWGADGPSGPARRPVFVVTHEAPAASPEAGVYTFVTDGIESALRRAKAAAGAKDVAMMGGADVARQYLRAGLVDELSIHLVPVLFGGGTRLFDHLGQAQIRLEPLGAIETAAATHLRWRVERAAAPGS